MRNLLTVAFILLTIVCKAQFIVINNKVEPRKFIFTEYGESRHSDHSNTTIKAQHTRGQVGKQLEGQSILIHPTKNLSKDEVMEISITNHTYNITAFLGVYNYQSFFPKTNVPQDCEIQIIIRKAKMQ